MTLSRVLSHRVSQFAVALAVACLLGLVSVVRSPLQALIGLAGIGFLVLIVNRPEVGLLVFAVLTSTAFDPWRTPSLEVGLTFYLMDVILFGSLALVLLRGWVEPGFDWVGTPLDLPLLIFYGIALFSTVLAILRGSLSLSGTLAEIRVISAYLTFFIVTNLIRDRQKIRVLVRGLLFLAMLVVVVMVAQYLTDASWSFISGRVEELRTRDTVYEGVTRVILPGRALIFLASITWVTMYALKAIRAAKLLPIVQGALLAVGLVLTFLRSYWLAAAMCMVALLLLTKRRQRQRLLALGMIVLALGVGLGIASMSRSDSLLAKLSLGTWERLTTLAESDTVQESSVQLRYVENEYALQSIQRSPLIGSGLGATYRPWDPRIDWRDPDRGVYDGRAFLHHGHLAVLVKTGALGYVSLLWVSLLFLIRGFRNWRRVSSPEMRATVLAFTLTYASLIVAAFVNATFVNYFWTPILGIMMGVNEAIYRLDIPASQPVEAASSTTQLARYSGPAHWI